MKVWHRYFPAGAMNAADPPKCAASFKVIKLEVMRRTIHAWVLLCSFSVVALSPLGVLGLSDGRTGCCAAHSCCSSGHCNMARMDHRSKMPPTCPMTKQSHNGHQVKACSCAVSPHAPPLIENSNHITLAFDPVDYSAPAAILAASPFVYSFSATPLSGSAPPLEHPPRLFA